MPPPDLWIMAAYFTASKISSMESPTGSTKQAESWPSSVPAFIRVGELGKNFQEVMSALTGTPSEEVRISEKGEQIVSVAVPVQRVGAVLGVLMLSTQGGDIDAVIASERFAIFQVFAVAAGVMIIRAIWSM